MAYLFDDDKSKVNFDDQLLESLFVNNEGFQFGIENEQYGYYGANGVFHPFRNPSGNATPAQVLSGRTFSNATQENVAGVMPNLGQWTSTPSQSGNVLIPEGYHNGTGYVDTTNVFDAGKTAAEAVTWTEQITTPETNNSDGIDVTFLSKNAVSIKLLSKSTANNIYITQYDSSYNSISRELIVNTPYTINNVYNQSVLVSKKYNGGSRTYDQAVLQITYQAKKLR